MMVNRQAVRWLREAFEQRADRSPLVRLHERAGGTEPGPTAPPPLVDANDRFAPDPPRGVIAEDDVALRVDHHDADRHRVEDEPQEGLVGSQAFGRLDVPGDVARDAHQALDVPVDGAVRELRRDEDPRLAVEDQTLLDGLRRPGLDHAPVLRSKDLGRFGGQPDQPLAGSVAHRVTQLAILHEDRVGPVADDRVKQRLRRGVVSVETHGTRPPPNPARRRVRATLPRTLSSHTREPVERLAELTGDRLHRGDGAALVQLTLELATDIAHAEVGPIRDLERAALRAAKCAACMIRSWRSEARRSRARETKRGELIVREDALGMAAATLAPVPASVRQGVPASARAARANAGQRVRQLLAQAAQVEREGALLVTRLGGCRLRNEPAPHRKDLIGARPRVTEAIHEMMRGDEHAVRPQALALPALDTTSEFRPPCFAR